MQVLLDAWDGSAFVFVSRLDVYGLPQRLPVIEEHPLDPTYGDGNLTWCKKACEGLLRAQWQPSSATITAYCARRIFGSRIRSTANAANRQRCP
jgi:UDP-glucose 4-epimerase